MECSCAVLHMQAITNAPAAMTDADKQGLQTFSKHYDVAELYHAYSIVHSAAHQPFKTVDDSTLFNAAR
jgi:hypothetical protein